MKLSLHFIHRLLLKLGLSRPRRPARRDVSLHITGSTGLHVSVSSSDAYPDNRVVTSRYTLLNFLPKALFEQLQRLANFYFLLCGILQLFTDTPLPVYTSFMPLLSVMGIALLKQAIEDIQRHRQDDAVNARTVQRFLCRESRFVATPAEELRVGDLVVCHAEEEFPADLLLLSCAEKCEVTTGSESSMQFSSSAECYVNTASLDGETYLKECRCLTATQHWHKQWLCDRMKVTHPTVVDSLDREETGQLCRVQVQYDESTRAVHEFTGSALLHICQQLRSSDKSEHENIITTRSVPLSVTNVVMRGTRLQNTHHIVGMVLYTGGDTKMALNSHTASMKFSRVERVLNNYLVAYMILMGLAAVVCTVCRYSLATWPWYRSDDILTTWTFVQSIFGFVILFSYLVPVSLLVTMELEKFFSCFFIRWDVEMRKHEVNGEKIHGTANTSDLVEELGQVQYLFSDKTGTLTQNEMRFRRCAVLQTPPTTLAASGDGAMKRNRNLISRYIDVEGALCVEQHDMEAAACPQLVEKMDVALESLLCAMALCHTVRMATVADAAPGKAKDKRSKPNWRQFFARKRINNSNQSISVKGNGTVPEESSSSSGSSNCGNEVQFQASSPDEKAFVEACQRYGVQFRRSGDQYEVMLVERGELRRYRVLRRLDFDSVRKRMSIILQRLDSEECCDGGQITLFCKGGDESLQPLCRDQEAFSRLRPHVDAYGRQGLRTLVFATRVLSEEKFVRMSRELDQQEVAGSDEGVADAMLQFESELDLLGCTGVEDTLQDGVADTIRVLREAGIKVWVLTGDKKETAEQISLSTGLFDNLNSESTLELVGCTSTSQCRQRLIECTMRMASAEKKWNSAFILDVEPKFNLVIDSVSLRHALQQECLENFQRVCTRPRLSAVLCCRMEPLQKAEVVHFVKCAVKPEPITAAIGDGANDVSMIQAAHVGIAVYGKEGRQAVRASDYAVAEFRHLQRLLLVHGHQFYMRIVTLIQYFFYKNIVFVSPLFYFTIFSGFSAQTVYDPLYLMLYNMFFTSLPILAFGLLEQTISPRHLRTQPRLYRLMAGGVHLSWRHFLQWNLLGLWHSLVVYFGPHLLLFDAQSPTTQSIPELGTLVLCGVWCVVTLKLMILSHFLNWLYLVAVVPITLGGNLFLLLMYSETLVVSDILGQYVIIGTWGELFSSLGPWLTLVWVVTLALLPDLVQRWVHDLNLQRQLRKPGNPFAIPTIDATMSRLKESEAQHLDPQVAILSSHLSFPDTEHCTYL